jgi:hypothetical protein|tara:strand:- start:5880 stop:7043 length:1164 start_codon:yes stop_codon:yes gene_type:complete
MEMKVRAVESVEEKSMQEVEKELLDKHEEKLIEDDNQAEKTPQVKMDFTEEKDKEDSSVKENDKEEASVEEVAEQPYDLKEEDVLSYIGKRYGREINSLDELNAAREETEKLPEDVAAYFKYKKETGRGIEDYVKLQKDFSSMNPDNLLREYLTITEGEGLDPEDIDSLMEDYSYDEELDDEAVIKKTKLAKKRTIAKAKKFFNEQKELYKHPLESRPDVNSESNNEEILQYRQYLESAKTQQEESETKRNWFIKESDKVFTDDFKGFDFVLDDKTVTFSPSDVQTIKKNQETPLNFVNKYLDDKGLINDAVGYHRALSLAMNPDKFANFFYEQGKSEATEDVMRKTKNINMSERRAPEVTNKGGMTVKSVNPDSGRGLKIRSIKRK